MKHLDRDVAAEPAVVGLPHRRGRADIEAKRQLVAFVGRAHRARAVSLRDRALPFGVQPEQRLHAHRRVGRECLRESRLPFAWGASRSAQASRARRVSVTKSLRAPARSLAARRGSSYPRRCACWPMPSEIPSLSAIWRCVMSLDMQAKRRARSARHSRAGSARGRRQCPARARRSGPRSRRAARRPR